MDSCKKLGYIYIYMYIYKVRVSQYYVLFSRILIKYLASNECGALLCTPCRTVVGPTQETVDSLLSAPSSSEFTPRWWSSPDWVFPVS
jgi:hypothetical protein